MSRALTRAAARAAATTRPITRAVANKLNISTSAPGRGAHGNASRAPARRSAASAARISRTPEQKRREMFRKRTDTLFKKAKELHENTGAEVYVLFRDKNATTWADDSHHGFDGCAFGDEAPGNIKQVLDQVHGTGRRPRKRGPKKGARAARSLAESYSPQGQHSDFVDADEQLLYDLAEEDDPMPDPMLDPIPDTIPDTIQVATSGALPEVRTEALSHSALPAEAMQYDVSDADQNVTVDCNAQEAALLVGLTGADSVPDVLLDQDRPYADAPHEFEIGPLGGFANVVQSVESPQLYGAPLAVAPQDAQFVACESFSDLFPPEDDQLDYSTLLFSSTDEFSDFLAGDQYSSVQRETHHPDRVTEGSWQEEMSRPLSGQKAESCDEGEGESRSSPQPRAKMGPACSTEAKVTVLKEMLQIISDYRKSAS